MKRFTLEFHLLDTGPLALEEDRKIKDMVACW